MRSARAETQTQTMGEQVRQKQRHEVNQTSAKAEATDGQSSLMQERNESSVRLRKPGSQLHEFPL